MVGQFPNPAGFHSIPDAKLFVYEERPDEVAGLVAGVVGHRAPS